MSEGIGIVTKKKNEEKDPEGPFLAEAQPPVQAGSPTVDRTAITVRDGVAFVQVARPDEPFSSDELHNLRRQCDAAFIEVS